MGINLDITRLPRGGFIITEGRAQVPGTIIYETEDDACYRLPKLTEKLQLARAPRIPCLSCTTRFPSLGPHNRLCDTCRGAG